MGSLQENLSTFAILSRSVLLITRNVSDKSCRENPNTHFVFNNCCPKNRAAHAMWRNISEETGHRWQHNEARALCMVENFGYRHTLRTYNADCFSTATMVTRTRWNVTFVHSCQQKSIGLKFSKSKPEVTCGTVAIIIRVVLLSPYLCIRAVSLSSIHYNQSHRVYINRRRQYICLIWNKNIN